MRFGTYRGIVTTYSVQYGTGTDYSIYPLNPVEVIPKSSKQIEILMELRDQVTKGRIFNFLDRLGLLRYTYLEYNKDMRTALRTTIVSRRRPNIWREVRDFDIEGSIITHKEAKKWMSIFPTWIDGKLKINQGIVDTME